MNISEFCLVYLSLIATIGLLIKAYQVFLKEL